MREHRAPRRASRLPFRPATSTTYPGGSTLTDFAEEQCVAAFQPYVGRSYESSELFVRLYLESGEKLTGSMRGTNR